MRGADETSGSLFSHVDLEARIPTRHPLRKIRQVVKRAIVRHWSEDNGERVGQPGNRQLMEQMQYNFLFRWFVGLGIDDAVWACDEGKPFRLGDCFSGLLGPGRGWPHPGDRGAAAAAFIRD